MIATEVETRVVRALRTGSKVSILSALPFLVAAVYFYFAPIIVSLDGAGMQSCGSRFSPPLDAFELSRCSEVIKLYGTRSGACLALGLLISVVGMGLFGFDTLTEAREDLPTSS